MNEHNGWVPRDFWLEPWEKEAIIEFPSEESAGRISAIDVHDAGCRRGGGQSVQRLAGAETSRTAGAVEEASPRARAPASSSRRSRTNTGISMFPTSTCRGTFYYLCSVLDGFSRSLVHWDLRESMTEAEIEMILGTSQGEVPGSETADHLRQRAAVHRAGLQGVHSHLGYDSCANLAVLSAVERQIGTLAQIAQTECIRPRTPLTREDAAPPDSKLCGSLQHGAPAQRHRLCDAAGYARRATGRDPRRTRS